MTDQRRRRPRDPAQLAKFVIDVAQGGLLDVAQLRDDALKYLQDHPPAA